MRLLILLFALAAFISSAEAMTEQQMTDRCTLICSTRPSYTDCQTMCLEAIQMIMSQGGARK